MVQPKRIRKISSPDIGNLPTPQGDESGAKWLIGAVLAAGQDNCQCTSCQLLRKFGGKLSKVLLEEEPDAGSGNP